MKGNVPAALDLPTGLGKTSVMAIWLIARVHGARLPRRLIYVVDRRAVVDQATAEAEKLRVNLDRMPEIRTVLGLGDGSLPISTLRGQFIDNRDWLADPAAPGIVVGTVDMIGSRLLFSGYGVSPKMRSYHAGFLGADTLVVLDEAHLVPPFERLLVAIEDGAKTFGARFEGDRGIVPAFRLMPLSATGRQRSEAFRLEEEDREDEPVRQRLTARKALTITATDKLAEMLAGEAWALTKGGTVPIRCVIYCNLREDAEKTKVELDNLAKGKAESELFVGARRVKERVDANEWLRCHGFLAGSDAPRERPAFLIATSAGEVGVDLDADHMVCDLVPWERMVQRLGRVNRLGKWFDTEVRVIAVADGDVDGRLATTRKLLDRLPEIDGTRNASPGTLLYLREQARPEEIAAASTPAPLRPALTRALVDAWSMTSLAQHTGRPEEVGPWLRGWIEDDKPQTAVVWRTHLPVRVEGGNVSDKEVADFFEAAPPHASEILETESWRVVEWLVARAVKVVSGKLACEKDADIAEVFGEESSEDAPGRLATPLGGGDVVAFALEPAGDVRQTWHLRKLAEGGGKDLKEQIKRGLAGATLVVDARMGGMKDGLLNKDQDRPPLTADDGSVWLPPVDGRPVVRFRVHPPAETETKKAIAHGTYAFATRRSIEGEDQEVLLVETWTTEESRAASVNPQLLVDHQSWTERCALTIALAVGLTGDHKRALAVAARLHDEGKKATRWQRAFNAPDVGKVYAKTRGPIRHALLDGYRHEFGSLPRAEEDAGFKTLAPDIRDLVLHMIAAHHGRARPLIETTGCDDAPPSVLEGRARDVALRFARLQKRWGPWGLAWWEALLRAADQQASRDNDACIAPENGEVV
jgi:CRISPR-associated endonuclease/helicase Cas3